MMTNQTNQSNIRPLTKEDYNKGYLNLLGQLTTIETLDYPCFCRKLTQIQSNPNHLVYVIETDNRIIANITLLIEPKFLHHNQNVAHLEDFIIDSQYRRLGIGKKLIRHCQDVAKSHNCYKLILNCDQDLVGYYGHLGFIQKNHEMSCYF